MQYIKSLGITLCLLLTTLFVLNACEEDFYGDEFTGRWYSAYTTTEGVAMEAIYYFDGDGRGSYTIYYAGSNYPIESSNFTYDADGRNLYVRYTTGNSDRFEYAFDGPNHFRLGYYDRYGVWVEEYYTRR